MNNLGKKIKEIRIKKGLSQEAFAKELGYTSRSTINKIEKGINDISYEKLMLLIDQYQLVLDDCIKTPISINENGNSNSIVFLSFDINNESICERIANHLKKENDIILSINKIKFTTCSNCNCECNNFLCSKQDQISNLFRLLVKCKKIVFILPFNYNHPCSLFFQLNERLLNFLYFNQHQINNIKNKTKFICAYSPFNNHYFYLESIYNLINNEKQIIKVPFMQNEDISNRKEAINILDKFINQ